MRTTFHKYKRSRLPAERADAAILNAHLIHQISKPPAKNPHAERIIRDLHFLLFPEEYDQQADSIAHAADRCAGRNPMNAEYVETANARRVSSGFQPLDQDGLPASNETMQYLKTCFAKKDVEALADLATRHTGTEKVHFHLNVEFAFCIEK